MGAHASVPASSASGSPADRDATAAMVALRRIVRVLRLADREAASASGLSAAQLFVLHALGDAPAASLVELAQRTLTDPSSVSTVVERLVTRKLVHRQRAKDDARRAELGLTAAGERVLRQAPRVPQVAIAGKLRGLPAARRAALTSALEDLVGLLGANDLAPNMMFDGDDSMARRRTRGA